MLLGKKNDFPWSTFLSNFGEKKWDKYAEFSDEMYISTT